ncbi:MAG: glycosyltransferase [Bacteroidota bacterium]
MEKVKQQVLVAPLNWGLGHAARCIPLIRRLIQRGLAPILASDGMALQLLTKEFPQLKTYPLPGYDIVYPNANMVWNMAIQLPKIMQAIRRERQVIAQIVKTEQIDLIFSDNRYGCRHANCVNIFITHQLNIRVPFFPLAFLVARGNHWWIRQFDHCWVPDNLATPHLAGELAHGTHLPNARYIGILSRMRSWETKQQYDLVIVLSGPEPQRSYLESILLEQAESCTQRILFIRGLTDREEYQKIGQHLEVRSYLTTEALNRVLCTTDVVLCRSGYSSLMDLVKLEKKAILIPTPGQTEQEYLAQRFAHQQICCVQQQDQINLSEALRTVKTTKGFAAFQQQDDLLDQALDELLRT